MNWQGKVEFEGGIRVITNSGPPLYGELKMDLKKEISIGREDDPNYLFYRIRGIAIDKEGNIFVDDLSNYRIQKYDPSGKYLQTIGRHGQGPGELQFPQLIRIEETTGNIFVKDYATNITIFNNRGQFLRTLHLNRGVEDFVPNDNETILAILWLRDEIEKQAVGNISATGEILNIYDEFAYSIYSEKAATTGREMAMTTGFEFSVHIAEVDKETIVYGYSKKYELKVASKTGNVLYQIRKKEPVPKFTKEEKNRFDELKKRLPLFKPPSDKPFFYNIYTDSRGRIYVQRNKAVETIQGYGPIDKEEKEVDVYNKDGYFIYRTTLPKNTCVIRDGYLYAYDLNEDEGLESVQRYRISNWGIMKE